MTPRKKLYFCDEYKYDCLDFTDGFSLTAIHVLDEVQVACGERLTSLKLINASRMPFEMLGMVSHKMPKVTIFGHKHWNLKISTAFYFGSYLESNC